MNIRSQATSTAMFQCHKAMSNLGRFGLASLPSDGADGSGVDWSSSGSLNGSSTTGGIGRSVKRRCR